MILIWFVCSTPAYANLLQKIHNMVMPSWLNDTLYKQIIKVNNIAEDYLFGIGPNKSRVLQTEEMIKLRGGSILKAINENMQLKLFCIQNPSNATCRSFRTLKYYAYSAVGYLISVYEYSSLSNIVVSTHYEQFRRI